MFTRVVLYRCGLVVCLDEAGRQSPSYQGMYWDVIDRLKKEVDKEKVVWQLQEDSREVSFEEWVKVGDGLVPFELPSRPLPPHLAVRRSECENEFFSRLGNLPKDGPDLPDDADDNL